MNQNRIINRLTLFVSLSLLSLGVSCTNHDVLFGNGLVPPPQELSTLIDSSTTVVTSIFKLDSVPTSLNSGNVFLGSVWNPIVGLTTSNVMTTYTPMAFNLEKHPHLFGKNAVLDSMFMILNFDNVKGDTTYKLHISVHPIVDTMLHYYSTYYSNFVAEGRYDPTPIVEFDLSGGIRYFKQQLPRSYFEKLLFNENNPATNPYFSDSLFVRKFKGFYFKVRDVAQNTPGAIYRLTMNTSTLQLHYHNSEVKPDTTYVPFFFRVPNNAQGQLQSINVNFSVVKHDFTLADPSRGGVNYREIGDSTLSVPVVYTSGLAGLGARVVIDTAHLQSLRRKATAEGFNNIAIQRAALRWYLPAPTPETYTWSPSRIALYYNFGKNLTVPDYDPLREGSSNGTYTSDIGGYVDRSNGYYEQVITSTIQRLINRVPNASNVVQLFPSTGESTSYCYVALGGSTSTNYPPTMVLVYTMVR